MKPATAIRMEGASGAVRWTRLVAPSYHADGSGVASDRLGGPATRFLPPGSQTPVFPLVPKLLFGNPLLETPFPVHAGTNASTKRSFPKPGSQTGVNRSL